MKKKMLVILLLVGMMIIANVQQAQATIIDFGRVYLVSPGTISYAGGSAPLVGSGIQLDIVSDGSPLNSYHLLGGVLNFSTGAFTGSNANAWYFAPGGSITVTGVVDMNGNGIVDGGDINPVTPLMSGSFLGTPSVSYTGVGTYKVAGVAFEDLKDQDLAALFGLNANGYGYGWNGFFNLGLNAAGTPPAGFTSTSVISGDVYNEPLVPEPSSMLLLGMGLFGFAGRAIRKRFRV